MAAERRFWLLRRLSKGFTAGAWVVLAFVVVVTPVAVARAILQHDRDSLIEWLQYGASGLLIFVNLIWLAQSIQVVVAIEENTRHTGFVLEKLASLMQQVRDRLPDGHGAKEHGERGADEGSGGSRG
jgi:uncharacterized membrane protein